MKEAFNSEAHANETVDVRRVLRNGLVTHELMDRMIAEILVLSESEKGLVKSLRIQSMRAYFKEIRVKT